MAQWWGGALGVTQGQLLVASGARCIVTLGLHGTVTGGIFPNLGCGGARAFLGAACGHTCGFQSTEACQWS